MDYSLGKILWVLFAPAHLVVWLLFIAFLFVGSRRKDAQIIGRRVLFWTFLFLAALCVLPVGEWALTPLENLYPAHTPDKVDGVMVIGGDEDPLVTEARGQPTLRSSTQRYVVLADLARLYPNAKLLFTGGYPRPEDLPPLGTSNGSIAKAMATVLQIPASRMSYEDKSRTTFENARDAFAMMKPTPQENWILITSAFHMPRAMATFKKAGWNVFPMPTDYRTTGKYSFGISIDLLKNLNQLQTALHEYIGLVGYRVQGKVDTIWSD